MVIPFNKPYMTGKELYYISQAHFGAKLAGDGPFTKKCHEWLETNFNTKKALLTHSCTAALEMAALLVDTQPGDEFIMPSFTFVSTANAFVLRGGVPVFVDIKKDTLNIDETLIEGAITKKTKAIVVVHYAGVACEMDTILKIAKKHNLYVIEDAAQGFLAKYKDKYLGTFGDLGTLSFHETKNIISGEGGALLIQNQDLIEKAEIIREKGTNRTNFFRGQVDKYTWCSIGSSFLPGEITAAFLWAQLEEATKITDTRIQHWNYYYRKISSLNIETVLVPKLAQHCSFNAHIFYLIFNSIDERTKFIEKAKTKNIQCVFHYVPLHLSKFAKDKTRTSGSLRVTEKIADTLLRLPLYVEIKTDEQDAICRLIEEFFQKPLSTLKLDMQYS